MTLPRQGRRQAGLLLMYVALSAVLAGTALLAFKPGISGDGPAYLAAAQHPLSLSSIPYSFRLLVPLLVHEVSRLFGITISAAFFSVTVALSVALSTLLLFWLEEFEGIPRFATLAAGVIYWSSYPGLYNLRNFADIDFATVLAVTAGVIAIRKRRFLLLVSVVVLGSLVKETVAVLLPVYFLYELGLTRKWLLLKRSLLLAGAIALVFVSVRSGLVWQRGAELGTYTHGYLSPAYLHHVRQFQGGLRTILGKAFALLPAAWPFVLLGFVLASTTIKRLSILAPLAAVQILLATDIQRMLCLSTPVLLLLLAKGLLQLRPWQAWTVSAASIGSCVTFYSLGGYREFILSWYLLIALWALQAGIRAHRSKGNFLSKLALR